MSRRGTLAADAAAVPTMFVSVPHLPAVPQSEPRRRLSASSSIHEASITASRSKLSTVDTHAVYTAQPQTLAECQEFIRQLQAESVKQAQMVVILLCKLVTAPLSLFSRLFFFSGDTGLASTLLDFFLNLLYMKRTFEHKWHRPDVLPDRALKETQGTVPNQWHGLIFVVSHQKTDRRTVASLRGLSNASTSMLDESLMTVMS